MKFTSFVQLLHSGATNYPDNVALLYDEGGTTVKKTYAQLYADVKDRVRALESMKETCVGILEAPSEKWLVDMFACVIAGKQTVLLDAMSDAATLQKCVLATDVETILTDNLTAPYATALTFCPHTLNRTDGEGDILFFTSGTTESSKAVVLTSKSLCASAWNGQERCPCNENDNLLCVLPLTHVFGFVCSMLWPLSQGACVSLTRGLRYLPFDAKYFNPTIISVVPSVLKFLLNFNALNDNLRMVLVGAGPASEQVLDAVKAKGVEIRFGYGLTETSSGVAISTCENPFAMTPCHDDEITLSGDAERELALALTLSGESFYFAAREKAPNYLCESAYRIATAFSRFYHDNHILNEQDENKKNSRLSLIKLTKKVLEKHLNVLGIDTVEAM